jgi:NADP-dependent 3-hydroxy acid dehydrogenase YdfG
MEKPMSANQTQATRIAIVTGATSGIGEATARKFVAAGFAVVGNGRTAEKLDRLEKELGSAFLGVAGNATDESVQEKLFATAIERFGREADIVVVNAGRGLGGSVTTADLDQFEEVLKINVVGAATLMQKASQKMVRMQQDSFPNKAADIIVIGSVAGRNVTPFSTVYSASKFAVNGLAEGLRREIGPKGVRVTLIEPGFVLSGFQSVAGYSDSMVKGFDEKFGPVLNTEDIANAIHFVIMQPPHVHIGDIVIRPTRQDYP